MSFTAYTVKIDRSPQCHREEFLIIVKIEEKPRVFVYMCGLGPVSLRQ